MPGLDPAPDAEPLGLAALSDCPHCGTRILPLGGRLCPACRRDLDAPPDRTAVAESNEVQLACQKLARRLIRGHATPEEVERNLQDRGIHPDAIPAIVQVAQRQQADADRDRGRRAVRSGGWCLTLGAMAMLLAFDRTGAIQRGRLTAVAVAIVLGLIQISWGIALARRTLPNDRMKSGRDPVDRRIDYLD